MVYRFSERFDTTQDKIIPDDTCCNTAECYVLESLYMKMPIWKKSHEKKHVGQYLTREPVGQNTLRKV